MICLQTKPKRVSACSVAWALIAALVASGPALAAPADIADVPLTSSSTTVIKPNVMFVLDDSGSMGSTYMPDDAGVPTARYTRYASQCNGLAYNPNITYALPVDATGATRPLGTYADGTPANLNNRRTVSTTISTIQTGAITALQLSNFGGGDYDVGDYVTLYSNDDPSKWMLAIVTAVDSRNDRLNVNVTETAGSGALTNPMIGDHHHRAFYYTYNGTEPKLSYTYGASGVDTTSTFYTQCNSLYDPTNTLFTRVLVSTLTGAALQNYQNWYTYYRTRMLMMKSSVSLAFAPIDSRYRVGFTTISSKVVDGTNFLDIDEFTSTQKTNFYSSLNAANPSGYTPLRGALAKAGQYYAKKGVKGDGTAQTFDPMQYSCQRNYTILTTDGYWNTNHETASYGPKQLDATTDVGQQDGVGTPRPLKDEAGQITQERTSTLQQRTISYPKSTSQLQQRTVDNPKSTSQLQQRTVSYPRSTSQLQQRTLTPQWQVTTTPLQQTTNVLYAETSTNSGATWSAPAVVATCTWDTSGSSRRRCSYGGWGAPTTVASCTAVPLGTVTTGGTTWSTGVQCAYAAPLAPTVAGSCTAVPLSSGPSYSTGVACAGLPPLTGPWSNTGSCTVSATRGCQYDTWTAYAPASSCTAVAQSTGPNYTVGTAVRCDPPVYGTWTDTPSCTASATLQCQYAAWTPYTSSASCTAVNQSAGPTNYTVGTAVRCNPPVYGTWTDTSSCSVSSALQCQYTAWTAYTNDSSCTTVNQSASPNYTVGTAVRCNPPVYGTWTNTSSCTASSTLGCQYTAWTPWLNVASCTAEAQSTNPNYTVGTARECQTLTTGGTSNTLADVAMYYYQTDLRTSTLGNCSATVNGNTIDVCNNNLTASGADDATHQHMTTFTLGLGVNGTLKYRSDYQTAQSGDFHEIRQGTKDWPVPTADSVTAVDDLWHAAVNGRGRYFSATDPTSLAQSLSQTLLAIDAKQGFGSAAAASNLQPVPGDNSIYLAKYKTKHWVGDLISYKIDPVTGAISTPQWSAAQLLQAKVTAGTPRDIYYMKRNAASNQGVLRPFTDTNLSADGLGANFSNVCSKAVPLTQCSALAANKAAAIAASDATALAAANAALTAINSSANVVDYLRGGSNNAIFRPRFAGDTDIGGGIMGDIIGGAPVYVGKPNFRYTENNYTTFAATVNASRSGLGRRGMVYVAANDGMLHAFDGATGDERWAYVPTMVMDRMYRLADNAYDTNHQFLVNGAPVVGDIYLPPVAPATTGTWKTILVGGLGAGGQGYYALDITDPDNPQALWEFRNTDLLGANDSLAGNGNLGLTFGNPVITKRTNGTWIVAFSSGYNNHVTGDGNGRLFVVDAATGARVKEVQTYTSGSTAAGTTTTPNGLGKINAWINAENDNTARRFYGGDLLGNLWRFDIDNLVAPNQAALRLAELTAGGVPQPVTIRPELAEVDYLGSKYPVVYVATGKYLGTTDPGKTDQQTIYALKDPMTNTPLGDVRASSSVVAQTLSEDSPTSPRTISSLPVDWSTKSGWRIDLLSPGERVNVDMRIVFNTLAVASTVPSTDVCFPSGSSYVYQLDIGNGSARSSFGTIASGASAGKTIVGIRRAGTVVGISFVTLQLPNAPANNPTYGQGQGDTIGLGVDSDKGLDLKFDFLRPPGLATGRRTSWRELVN